ncbi:MAG: hypothetical protein Q8K29_17460 [Polaromonas sp.]|nr:hypothetical protein [Polaromonas sp.]
MEQVLPTNTSRLHTSLLVAATLLAGCGGKPPGCADSTTIGLANEMIAGDVLDVLTKDLTRNSKEKADPEAMKLATDYTKGLKVTMENIVSNGYNADAKKHQCAGRLKVATPKGNELAVNTGYSTQKTEGGNTSFVLAIDNYQPMIKALYDSFIPYMIAELEKSQGARPQEPIVYQSTQSQTAAKDTGSAALAAPTTKYTKDNAVAQIQIQGNQLVFEVNSTVGRYSCEMSGTASMLDERNGEFKPADKGGCIAKFKFIGAAMEFTTDSCSTYCGMQAGDSMDGTYFR